MRSKLTILFLLYCVSAFSQLVKVPDTNTFPFSDTYNSVYSHNQSVQRSLSSVFSYSVDGFYNALYKGNKDRLSNLRDYDPNRFAINLAEVYAGYNFFQTTVEVYNSGTQDALSVGIAWSTSPNPSLSNYSYRITMPSGDNGDGFWDTDPVSTANDPINQNTVYYIRPYIQYVNGSVYYGNERMVLTPTNVSPTPILSVSIDQVVNITDQSFDVRINVVNCMTIIERGVIYKRVGYSTEYTDGRIGTMCGNWTASVSDYSGTPVLPNTQYTVRPYVRKANTTYVYGDWVTFTTAPTPPSQLQVGDSYGGGIIAHIFQPGEPRYVAGQINGLIAMNADLTYSMNWSHAYTTTGATSGALGNGLINTTIIVSSIGDGTYAAKACYDLVHNGFDDWFLPTIAELRLLFTHKDAIGGFTCMTGSNYWTSTETSASTVYVKNFCGEGPESSSQQKNVTQGRTRACRYFKIQ